MTLFLGLIFGGVGTVYLYIAKKEHDPFYLIVGFLLIIYPYIFSSALMIVLVGIVLSLIPLARAKGYI
ncbi:MAG TPA: hypothetical protein VL284_08875 [Thermoanaerobaculia bacterium]|nr:hypothetical protein [Thermoanaerobaculia bacterium]